VSSEDRRRFTCAEVIRHIRAERVRRGISMNRLAGMAGLSQSMVSRLESDPKNPTLDTLLRLADALELDLGAVIQQALANITSSPKAKMSRRLRVKPKG
jgi:transcriptional regulator with XRE-family HTH domain